MSITEFHFSKTEFNTPRTSTGARAVADLIVRLILLEPGCIQSHPDMGVGLMSNYHLRLDTEEGIVNTLISHIRYQIDKYLPIAKEAKFDGTFKNNRLSIFIKIDNNLYKAIFDDSNNMEFIALEELKEKY